jgi:hypothetical protein
MANNENIDIVLQSQDINDKIFAQTMYLKDDINSIRCAKQLAGRGSLELDDVSHLAHCTIASRYKPYISTLHQYTKSNITGGSQFGTTIDIDLKSSGSDFTGDTVIILELEQVSINTSNVLYKFIDFPGVRIFKEVRFLINGQIKDKYTYQNVMDIYNNELTSNQKIAFERCVGQQQPRQAKYHNEDLNIQQAFTIYDGLQTYKKNHSDITFVIPIWFFFCRNPSTPINNHHVSDKNTSIQIVLAEREEFINLLDSSNNPVNYVDGGPSTLRLVHITTLSRSIWLDNSLVNIFNHTGKTLIRSWGHQEYIVSTNSGSVDLNIIRFPVDRLYIRFVPIVNTDLKNIINRDFVFSNWHKASFLTQKTVLIPHFQVSGPTLVARSAIYYEETEPVHHMRLQIDQVNYLGDDVPGKLLSAYTSLYTNGSNSVGPITNSYMISFDSDSEYAKSNKASGYIDFTNLSAKFLHWESNIINKNNPVKIQISWRYLNFIWPKSDGNIEFMFVSSQNN